MLIKKTLFIEKRGIKEKVIANILDFPNLVQPNDYSCGVVCVQGVLRYYGDRKRQERALENILKADTEEGTKVKYIVEFFRKERFKVDEHQMTIKNLETYVKKGVPIIVLLQARSDKKVNYGKAWDEGHYVVVIGYAKEYIFFADPVTYHICYLSKKEFAARRHDQDDTKEKYINHGIAVYGKKSKYDSSSLRKIN